MNWTDQNCLILIEKYRAHECLWNPSNPDYRSLPTKNAAWKQIADDLDLPQDEMKKKVNSLLASFRRERAKEGRLIVDMGSKRMYHSKWFAFKHMNFLLDRCCHGKNIEETKNDDVDAESDTEIFFTTKNEVFENSDSQDHNIDIVFVDNLTSSEVFSPEPTSENKAEEPPPKKRPKVHHFNEEQNEFDRRSEDTFERCRVYRHEMEWTDTNSLLLIEEYRVHECLWNPGNSSYRSLPKKAAAWKEISERFDVSQEEIKKKMNSLLASFRRERAKNGTTVIDMGHERIYRSRWFAFKPMSFLMDKFNQNKIKHSEVTNKDNREIENEGDILLSIKDETLEVSEIEFSDLEPDMLENLSNSSVILEDESMSEVKIENLEPKEIPELHKLCELRKNGKSKDKVVKIRRGSSPEMSVVDAFGDYVVLKLKEYDSYVRNTIQHKISEIFFQADKGCFDKPSHLQ